VRRCPTGTIAERPMRTKRVARMGLGLVCVGQRMIPPLMGGKFVVKCNERQQYPQSSNLSQQEKHWENTIDQ
jgi:hypothetical protein